MCQDPGATFPDTVAEALAGYDEEQVSYILVGVRVSGRSKEQLATFMAQAVHPALALPDAFGSLGEGFSAVILETEEVLNSRWADYF